MLDHSVHVGNPADGPLLVPAIKRIAKRFGLVPAAVTSDRGYGEAKIEAELAEFGVETVAIPRKGKPSKARRDVEQAPKFHRLIKWRTGSEGRISYLKRRFGWDRTLLATLDGAETWCGLGVFTHNGIKISNLIATAATDQPEPATAVGYATTPGPTRHRTARGRTALGRTSRLTPASAPPGRAGAPGNLPPRGKNRETAGKAAGSGRKPRVTTTQERSTRLSARHATGFFGTK